MAFERPRERDNQEVRPIRVAYDIYPNAAGSVLFEMGKTRVLCSVVMQPGVPHFLRGKKSGWLTAEYSLLPASTPDRVGREATTGRRSGRTVEISRLIGRSLRSVVNLDVLGESTIYIDCDVLQADGGTRSASITAACLALKVAEQRWHHKGIITEPILTDDIAGISVGVIDDAVVLDLNFNEDIMASGDFNFVMTRSGKVVEIQGTAEREPIEWETYQEVCAVAWKGMQQLFTFFDQHTFSPFFSE